MKPINERLIELRDSVDMNRQAFATKVGIDQSTYSRYELGQTKPSLDTLEKISLTFPAIDARWLLTGHGEMKPAKSLPADPTPPTPTAATEDAAYWKREAESFKERLTSVTEQLQQAMEQIKQMGQQIRFAQHLMEQAGSFPVGSQEAAGVECKVLPLYAGLATSLQEPLAA